MSEPVEPETPASAEPALRAPPTGGWRPWGAGASLGLTAGTLALYFAAQYGVVALAAVFGTIVSGTAPPVGTLIAVSLLGANPVLVLVVVLLARQRGPVREVLGLRWAGWKPLLGWAAAAAAFLWLFELTGAWLGRPPVPEVMRRIYTTAEPKALLWLALVVMAPLFEELLFRGFLIPGLVPRLGAPGAVLVSGLAFAAIHLQYDLFDMSGVLALGLLFGAARVATGSTLLTLVLHAGVNLAAAVRMEWLVGG